MQPIRTIESKRIGDRTFHPIRRGHAIEFGVVAFGAEQCGNLCVPGNHLGNGRFADATGAVVQPRPIRRAEVALNGIHFVADEIIAPVAYLRRRGPEMVIVRRRLFRQAVEIVRECLHELVGGFGALIGILH